MKKPIFPVLIEFSPQKQPKFNVKNKLNPQFDIEIGLIQKNNAI
jgi:hypothetical protein